MTLAEVWTNYMHVLREKAPVTASSIRPPRPATDVSEAERTVGSWTNELREFYLLQDGQDPLHSGATPRGEVLPELRILPLDEAVALHRWWQEHPHSIESLGPTWSEQVRTQSAGESAAMFLPEYIPVAEGLAGSLAYIDTRGGVHSGCVRFFSAESADEGAAAYESLSEFVRQVAESVEAGSAHGEFAPSIEDGILLWEELDD
ncbi:SMI1/KNR4 family protein [Rhodococcus sp. NBC_00294]|uniref:SMI1/KNR4 family protein n=1 Tax=Rhodococcus sp. NBC_00294 TaxID=2976004 RepID=UPI002E2E87E0|nr:SMI1/KNR4 family protein [Rhodococcus sp. NBC_00294]